MANFQIPAEQVNKDVPPSLKTCDGRFLILARVKEMLGMTLRSKMNVYMKWFNTHLQLKEAAEMLLEEVTPFPSLFETRSLTTI